MNGAVFDPEDRILVLSVNVDDITIQPESETRVTLAVHLDEGIEIVHSGDRLWRPV